MDAALFRWINGWPEGLNPIFQLFSEGNKWWPVRIALLLIVVSLAIWGGRKGRIAAGLSLIAWPLANFVCDLLKYGLKAPRPCVELSDVILRVHKLTSFGTASAHSASMAAVAFVMIYYLRGVSWVWLGVAVLTGLSRIYVGVHYPSQVLFGWIVGILSGAVTVCVFEWLQRRKTIATPDNDVQTDELPETD